MDEKTRLDIKLQMEVLVTKRTVMQAENEERKKDGLTLAHDAKQFRQVEYELGVLLNSLREL
jgi:hypothetical protein